MSVAPWAIPVGTLAGLCVAGFIFIWWWFPRTWKKGTQQELEIIAEQARQRKLAQGENTDGEGAANPEGDAERGEAPAMPKNTTFTYTPQPIATF